MERLVDDRQELQREADACGNEESLRLLLDLAKQGLIKIRVTRAGLSQIAKDGLVRVGGVDHVQDCVVVEVAARGVFRPMPACSCGSAS